MSNILNLSLVTDVHSCFDQKDSKFSLSDFDYETNWLGRITRSTTKIKGEAEEVPHVRRAFQDMYALCRKMGLPEQGFREPDFDAYQFATTSMCVAGMYADLGENHAITSLTLYGTAAPHKQIAKYLQDQYAITSTVRNWRQVGAVVRPWPLRASSGVIDYLLS